MRKIFLTLAFLFVVASWNYTQAQSCSMIMCSYTDEDERGRTNLQGIFTGYKATAVGTEVSFSVFVFLQNYTFNQAHNLQISIEAPDGTTVITSDAVSVNLAGLEYSHSHTENFEIVMPMEGIYTIRCLINGSTAEELFFEVGD